MACTATAAELCKPIADPATCSFPSPEVPAESSHHQIHHHQHRQQKRQKQHHRRHQQEEERGEQERKQEEQPLLPGLPDHLAELCLSRLPARLVFSLCHSWRGLLYSPSFPPFLSLYVLLSSPSSSSSPVELQAFDPVAAAWRPLPPHPQLRHLLPCHPSFLSRALPVQSVAASGRLILLAATTHSLLPALPRPLVFHPITSRWHLGPPLRAPRRWCAAGAAGGRVYVASGISDLYSADVARSVERWDPASGDRWGSGGWERVAPLRDSRFSREAVEAVASGGKLCMVNVKGKAPKEGAVYDVVRDRWGRMPPGLLAGWTGPAAAAEEEEVGGRTSASGAGGSTIYVTDEAEGVLRAYDWARDAWTTVASSERLRGAVQMAVGGGRVCVAGAGGDELVVVDVASRPARMWAVELPTGRRVVALHVLPRMSHPADSQVV